MKRFGGQWEQSGRQHRGAVAVEYALGIALILVASIGAIDALQGSAESNISAHGATAGAPDLPDSGIPVTTSTTSPPPTTPGTPPPPGTVTANATFSSVSDGASTNNKWSPRVDVTVVDASTGEALTTATVTVQWTELPSGQTTTQTFNVPSTGVASFQLNNLSSKVGTGPFVDTVTVSIISVTGTNPVINFTPGPSATTSIDGPNT